MVYGSLLKGVDGKQKIYHFYLINLFIKVSIYLPNDFFFKPPKASKSLNNIIKLYVNIYFTLSPI